MTCKICGTVYEVKPRKGPRMTLCDQCAKGTPRKASRERFDAVYWGRERRSVPESIKREFYSDYKTSVCTLQQYVDQTTNEIV